MVGDNGEARRGEIRSNQVHGRITKSVSAPSLSSLEINLINGRKKGSGGASELFRFVGPAAKSVSYLPELCPVLIGPHQKCKINNPQSSIDLSFSVMR
jgi:hypothetical protein